MSHLTSHLNPPMSNPAMPVNPPAASNTVLPVTIHNDNQHGANESFHRPIRHGVAEGEAAPLLIAAYFTAMVFFVCLVLYGLNHQQSEPAQATTAAEAPAATSPVPASQTPQPQNNASQPAQPSQQQPNAPQGGQPANTQPPQGQSQQNAQPAAQQKPAPNAQQNAPSPKQ